ncbi:MAG: hypothetical protein LBS96_07910 [Oscillospiraceae bacterium]|jgi:hypothetical protein|nr:hypothetical protein [Oscillospiraceae bacterium]
MKITLQFDPCATIHISQVLVGFALLAKQGACSLQQERGALPQDFGHNQLVLARLADGTALAFDTHDAGELHVPPADFDAAMERLQIRAYFRRSLRAGAYDASAYVQRQRPLGLNYHVSCPANPYNHIALRDLPGGLKDPLARHNLLRKGLARLPVGRLSDRQFYPERFARAAAHPLGETILFLTRTWFPLEEHDPACTPAGLDRLLREMPSLAGILQMDETRAALIRLLRKEYGDRALAGFARNRFTEMRFPDLIAPAANTRRGAYLQTMQRAAVCLTTVGLHRSTGWKMGEYVAAAQAIVCEPLWDTLPGDFAPQRNYLPFAAPEEALRQTEYLLANPDFARQMRQNNAAYYEAHLRPERLVGNALAGYA